MIKLRSLHDYFANAFTFYGGGGSGGGSQTSTTSQAIDPMMKPYITYGLTEAQKLYQSSNPQYYSGQTFVSPSSATSTALQAAQNRAMAGSPLIPAAQENMQNLQTAQNMADPMYGSLYQRAQSSPVLAQNVYSNLTSGNLTDTTSINRTNQAYANANTNPSAANSVYSQFAAGNINNAANPYNQYTASGGYLGSNPYFNQALAGAGQAASQQYFDAVKQAQSGASMAGRYGSGVSADIQNRAANTMANTLTNKAGELGYQQYANERALQEAAMGRLASTSAGDIANRMQGAQALTGAGQQTYANQLAAIQQGAALNQQSLANKLTGAQALTGTGQQAYANQLAAAGGLSTNSANDLNRQLAAAQAAPALANADYTDINQLLQAGQAQEGYQQQALQADINKWNYNQNLPYSKLSNYLGSVYGAPSGTVATTNSTSSGGGKIVCTMMNESYGIGSFRNRVWIAHSARMPNAKVAEKGYHTLFLPLVAYAKKDGFTNRIVKNVLEHIAKHRTADIYKEMRNGKRDTLGRIYRSVLEPLCYVVGRMKGY